MMVGNLIRGRSQVDCSAAVKSLPSQYTLEAHTR